MVRETAANVLWERYFKGFEYIEESKMYYNAGSGLYYDPVSFKFNCKLRRHFNNDSRTGVRQMEVFVGFGNIIL